MIESPCSDVVVAAQPHFVFITILLFTHQSYLIMTLIMAFCFALIEILEIGLLFLYCVKYIKFFSDFWFPTIF